MSMRSLYLNILLSRFRQACSTKDNFNQHQIAKNALINVGNDYVKNCRHEKSI